MEQEIQEDKHELLLIRDFSKGYVYFLSSFQSLVNSFIQFLSAGSISEANKRDLLAYRKSIDQELNKNQKDLKDIVFNLDDKHMYPTIKKEYIRYFQSAYEEGSHTDFVQFYIIFEMLRTFLVESRTNWNEIKKSILEGKFNDPIFRDETILSFKINPALEKLEYLAIFLKRMGFILGIENPKSLFEKRVTKPVYREKVQYKLSAIFTENLMQNSGQHDLVSSEADVDLSSASKKSEPSRTAALPPPTPEKAVKIVAEKSSSVLNYIQAFGKYPWNSDPHYYFRYEPEKYLAEIEYFKSTINMDTHLGADEQMLRSEFIKSLSSIKRKTKTNDEYETEYSAFLKNFFNFIENIVIMNQGIPNQLKWVFLFHIGPSHFYMIAKKLLTEVNTGYLHVKSADGKKVTRLIPSEYVKKHVIDYWNKVILPNVGDEKNNLALLKRITEVVQEKYKETSAQAMVEYNKLPPEIRASRKIDELFRENMNHWMGAANIIVFKRFVKNNLS